MNSAILRYAGASAVEPSSAYTISNTLVEYNLKVSTLIYLLFDLFWFGS
jgi:hypothetical protein